MSEYRVDILKPQTLPEGLVEDAFSIASKIEGPIKYRLIDWDYEPYSEMVVTEEEFDNMKVHQRRSFVALNNFISEWRNKETPESIPIGARIHSLEEVLTDCMTIAKNYRNSLEGGPMPDLVLVMTTRGNTSNFFAEGASRVLPTAMIQVNHTVMQTGNPHLLLAYYFAAMPLKAMGFNEEDYIQRYSHLEPQGCMNDLGASNVHHLKIKTKTADICEDCKKVLKAKEVPFKIIKHVREIFNLIREIQIHIEDIFEDWEEHKMVIGNNIHFPNIGKSVGFSPKEIAVYLLFLNTSSGLKYTEIDEKQNEFREIYGKYSRLNSNEEIDEVVNNICDISDSAALRQTIAKCNRKLKLCLEVNYEQFLLDGPNGGKKSIDCNRELVSFDNGWEL